MATRAVRATVRSTGQARVVLLRSDDFHSKEVQARLRHDLAAEFGVPPAEVDIEIGPEAPHRKARRRRR
eukprot:SAG22_NODE_4159_length_1364_cov_1.264822_1_plen_68_part_10